MAKEGIAQQHGAMSVMNRHLEVWTGCRPDDNGIPWQGKEGSLTTAQIKVDRDPGVIGAAGMTEIELSASAQIASSRSGLKGG